LLQEKLFKLNDLFFTTGSVIVLYSGGVDSTLLAYLATEQLGDRAVCVTVESASLSNSDLLKTKKIGIDLGFNHVLLKSSEFDDERYVENNKDRCYWCKKSKFVSVNAYAHSLDIHSIIDGSNLDDLNDLRPGTNASIEAGIRSPFIEVEMNKEEIRASAFNLNLPNCNSPSNACLSTRIPFGTPITIAALKQIERAEDYIHSLGINQIRVRHHNTIARLEVEPADFSHLIDHRDEIITVLHKQGYKYITLDLSGFKSGSMNI